MNNVGFMISEEEDLALGPGIRLDHSVLLCSRSFITVKKDRKLLTYTSEGGQRVPPLASFIKALYTFSVGY